MKSFLEKVWKWVSIDGLIRIESVSLFLVIIYSFSALLGSPLKAMAFSVLVTLLVTLLTEVLANIKRDGVTDVHDLDCDFIGVLLGLVIITILSL